MKNYTQSNGAQINTNNHAYLLFFRMIFYESFLRNQKAMPIEPAWLFVEN